MKSILKYFPEKIKSLLSENLSESVNSFQTLEEIRLRVERPIILRFNTEEKVIKYNVNTEDILGTLQYICENSIYSYQNQISSGYITIKGGHRVRNKWECSFRRH